MIVKCTFLYVWILQCISIHSVYGGCYSIESCLYDSLLGNGSDYSNQVRPAVDPYTAISVDIILSLKSILGLEEKNEVLDTVFTIEAHWLDEFLQFDQTVYPVDFILVKADKIWLPDFTIINNAEKFYDSTYREDFKAYITSTGYVIWTYGGIFKTSCSIQLSNYPFDTQECAIEIQNWAYTSQLVNITAGQIELDDYSTNSLWALQGTSVTTETKVHSTGLEYPQVTYKLTLKRLYSYYILNLILPCMLVSCAALGVFWLPSDSGEKISLGITVLLAYSVFQIVIMDATPVNSQETPMISKLIMSIMTLTTASVVTAMVTIYISFKKPNSRVPKWLRVVAFQGLAKLFCMMGDIPQESEDFKLFERRNTMKIEPMKIDLPKVIEDKKSFMPRDDGIETLIKQVEKITLYLEDKQRDDFICDEWKFLANVVDRLCFWVFLFLFIVVAIPLIIVTV